MSKVRIQFTLYSAFYSPLILSMAGGFLQREGLEYEWSISPPGKPATDSVVDGSADVVQSTPSQGFNAISRGDRDYPLHFALINETDGFFITGREADPDFSWNKLEDSEVVMFGGGQPNAMLRYACHRAGIEFDRIKAITPGGADDIDRAFRAGQGQYVQQQGPYPQQLEVDDVGRVVARVGSMVGTCAFSSLAASREWLATDVAKAFTRAYAATRHHLANTPAAEIAVTLQSWFEEVEPAALEKCIDAYQRLGCWPPHVEITHDAYEAMLDIFEYTGGISERYSYEQVCASPPGLDKV